MKLDTRLFASFSLLLSLGFHPVGERMTVQLFDTGTHLPVPLPPEAFSKQARWKLLPEDKTDHNFKGDLVLSNGKLALTLRQQSSGAEVYAVTPQGLVMRAKLLPVAGASTAALSSVSIVENNAGGVAVDATFKTDKEEPLILGYELKAGDIFVQTQPRSGVTGLRLVAPCRFAVLPDFFADDIVIDATELGVKEAELPSENLLMHMLGQGEAIVMAAWQPAKDDVWITLSGPQQARTITSSEINYAKEGKVCVAILNGPGIWHERDIRRDEGDKLIRLDWKAPFAAHWRVDWRRDDQLTDSWELLTQKPNGQYVRPAWYNEPEPLGNANRPPEAQTRWVRAMKGLLHLGPVDKQEEAFLPPPPKGVRFLGPALIYPINRVQTTPLAEFTVVDMMRATLGVGPCQYILDVEGHKKTSLGRPACVSQTILNNIYSNHEQKQKRDQVLKTLEEELAFLRHIRERIGDYIVFGHNMVAYLDQQKKTQPEVAELVSRMEQTARKMDEYVARREHGIKRPEEAARLIEEFRAQLVDREAGDVLEKCRRITGELFEIGTNEDGLVAECRMVVKLLRQQAALSVATDPRLANVAKEVRGRTQQMLRNPTSYEAPRG